MSEKDQILEQTPQNEEDSAGRIVWSSQRNNGSQRCWFCQYDLHPDYKDTEVLLSFLSPRGKILSKRITQTCSKHQRMLSKAIKVSREMALIR